MTERQVRLSKLDVTTFPPDPKRVILDREDLVDRLPGAAGDDADRSWLSGRLWSGNRRSWSVAGPLHFVWLEVDFLDLTRIHQARQQRRLAARNPLAAMTRGDGIGKANGDHARDVVRLSAFRAAD